MPRISEAEATRRTRISRKLTRYWNSRRSSAHRKALSRAMKRYWREA